VTAIAGVVGTASTERLKDIADKQLSELHKYGSAFSAIESIEHAAFGICAFREREAPALAGSHLLLAADTRLDNRNEILERVGSQPADATDSQLLLAAWLKSGEHCLDWIVGDFAFALFDSRDRSLALARDVTGQRPLFYARTPDGIAFASMPSGLRPVLGTLVVDRLLMAIMAAELPDTTDRSAFQSINRVRSGEIVRFRADGAMARRLYWDPSIEPLQRYDPDDLVAEYRQLLDRSVAARLSDCGRPVAAHLSGGFDSGAVTATAARILKSPDSLIAFTSAPAFAASVPAAAGFADESAIAAETAAMHGLRHIIVRDPQPIAEVIREQGPLLEFPILNPFNMAWWVRIRQVASSADADCLLTGEMGNLSLNSGGLTSIFSEWVRRRRWRIWWQQARIAARRDDTSWRGIMFHSFAPWMPSFLWHGLQRVFVGVQPPLAVTFLRPEWASKAVAASERDYQPAPNEYRQSLNIIREHDYGDLRMAGMAGSGIEERDPMADRRLIEFGLRIPPDQLYWDGIPRPLMRRALADRLPKATFEARGRGFQAADWAARFTQADARMMFESISANHVARDLFDLDRMRAAIDRWPDRDVNRVWNLQRYRISLINAFAIGLFAASYEGS
jgi:asparagine synthase (glutamine-hydrolysing)